LPPLTKECQAEAEEGGDLRLALRPPVLRAVDRDKDRGMLRDRDRDRGAGKDMVKDRVRVKDRVKEEEGSASRESHQSSSSSNNNNNNNNNHMVQATMTRRT